jgi:hypothetical protein
MLVPGMPFTSNRLLASGASDTNGTGLFGTLVSYFLQVKGWLKRVFEQEFANLEEPSRIEQLVSTDLGKISFEWHNYRN